MKIRTKYVSNSSSSSFVVIVRDYKFFNESGEFLISNENITRLINFGFKYMKGYGPHLLIYPEQVTFNSLEYFNEEESINLYMDCTCNQEDISDFLFKYKIPFIASIHNDDELWIYKGGTYYDIIQNYASQYITHIGNENYENQFIQEINSQKPHKRINLNEN